MSQATTKHIAYFPTVHSHNSCLVEINLILHSKTHKTSWCRISTGLGDKRQEVEELLSAVREDELPETAERSTVVKCLDVDNKMIIGKSYTLVLGIRPLS